MEFKKQIERSAVIIVLTATVVGFMAGFGAYGAILRSGHMKVLSQDEVRDLKADRIRLGGREREIDNLKQQLTRYSAWPPMYKDVQRAELRLSGVDDLLRVKVNGQGEFLAGFGETIPPFQIKDLLRQGINNFNIKIENNGGPCSGTATVLLNGVEAERWSVSKPGQQGNPCFEQSRDLILR